jgi:hypothetical protein
VHALQFLICKPKNLKEANKCIEDVTSGSLKVGMYKNHSELNLQLQAYASTLTAKDIFLNQDKKNYTLLAHPQNYFRMMVSVILLPKKSQNIFHYFCGLGLCEKQSRRKYKMKEG